MLGSCCPTHDGECAPPGRHRASVRRGSARHARSAMGTERECSAAGDWGGGDQVEGGVPPRHGLRCEGADRHARGIRVLLKPLPRIAGLGEVAGDTPATSACEVKRQATAVGERCRRRQSINAPACWQRSNRGRAEAEEATVQLRAQSLGQALPGGLVRLRGRAGGRLCRGRLRGRVGGAVGTGRAPLGPHGDHVLGPQPSLPSGPVCSIAASRSAHATAQVRRPPERLRAGPWGRSRGPSAAGAS